MKLRLARPLHLVDLGRVPGLAYVRGQEGTVRIGAMTTYAQLESSQLLRRRLPVLAQAAALVGDVQVRNRGTLGGSLAHADPAADLPAVVLALGATAVAAGPRGRRAIPADDFFVDMLTTALEPTEVLTEVRVPALPRGTRGAYVKFANKASHYAVVGVAAVITRGGGNICRRARVAFTGAGPKPLRATAVEQALEGQRLTDQAIRQASQHAPEAVEAPMSDIHASGEYRLYLTSVYTRRAILAALGRST